MMKNQRGMSLIEVLVTIVIIGIVFTLISQTTSFVTTATKLHDDKAEAISLAENELNKALDQLNDGGNPSSSTKNGYSIQVHKSKLNSGTQPPSPSLPRHVSISGVYLKAKEPQLITVTVSWGN